MSLIPGDKVVMINCYESRKYQDIVWSVASNPWKLGCGEEVVKLEGKSGGFATKNLSLVK